jgi:hypothetical protein
MSGMRVLRTVAWLGLRIAISAASQHRVRDEPIEGRSVGILERADQALERLPVHADVDAGTPGRASFEGSPSSCSSVETTVAKFGHCLSSSEKKAALSIVARTAS